MAVVVSNANAPAFEAKMTVYVFICVMIAAVGGLIFGYDIGISGLFSFSVPNFTYLHIKKQNKYNLYLKLTVLGLLLANVNDL